MSVFLYINQSNVQAPVPAKVAQELGEKDEKIAGLLAEKEAALATIALLLAEKGALREQLSSTEAALCDTHDELFLVQEENGLLREEIGGLKRMITQIMCALMAKVRWIN